MAEKRTIYKIQDIGGTGQVSIADDVVTMVAALAATEVEGVASLAGNITNEIVSRQGVKSLSARELSIIQLAAKGFSSPEVAEMLGISVNSVKTHFRHIFEKMDVSDRTEAVTLAISRGIIEN